MNDVCSSESSASFSDERLVLLAQQGSDRAFEQLLGRYRSFVRAKAAPYFIVGADRDDIIQEGMIGFFKAVRDFCGGQGVTFKTFAEICVVRQILTAVKNATRKKHSPLNSYVSLNKPIPGGEEDASLGDVIAYDGQYNPEQIVIDRENADNLSEKMSAALSDFELLVLSYYVKGYGYVTIADKLGKDPKSVDNALQRVKKKLEKIAASIE